MICRIASINYNNVSRQIESKSTDTNIIIVQKWLIQIQIASNSVVVTVLWERYSTRQKKWTNVKLLSAYVRWSNARVTTKLRKSSSEVTLSNGSARGKSVVTVFCRVISHASLPPLKCSAKPKRFLCKLRRPSGSGSRVRLLELLCTMPHPCWVSEIAAATSFHM